MFKCYTRIMSNNFVWNLELLNNTKCVHVQNKYVENFTGFFFFFVIFGLFRITLQETTKKIKKKFSIKYQLDLIWYKFVSSYQDSKCLAHIFAYFGFFPINAYSKIFKVLHVFNLVNFTKKFESLTFAVAVVYDDGKKTSMCNEFSLLRFTFSVWLTDVS